MDHRRLLGNDAGDVVITSDQGDVIYSKGELVSIAEGLVAARILWFTFFLMVLLLPFQGSPWGRLALLLAILASIGSWLVNAGSITMYNRSALKRILRK